MERMKTFFGEIQAFSTAGGATVGHILAKASAEEPTKRFRPRGEASHWPTMTEVSTIVSQESGSEGSNLSFGGSSSDFEPSRGWLRRAKAMMSSRIPEMDRAMTHLPCYIFVRSHFEWATMLSNVCVTLGKLKTYSTFNITEGIWLKFGLNILFCRLLTFISCLVPLVQLTWVDFKRVFLEELQWMHLALPGETTETVWRQVCAAGDGRLHVAHHTCQFSTAVENKRWMIFIGSHVQWCTCRAHTWCSIVWSGVHSPTERYI